jgi:NhaP-type Na+/H+ or K+/H+ antiporter
VVTLSAWGLLNLPLELALLFGALVVVTGPTVIVPLLRSVRPKASVARLLRWEGIVIDPLGAILAVLAYELVVATASRVPCCTGCGCSSRRSPWAPPWAAPWRWR